MDYGELVKSAFWLSLRNRYLWFFGFFAGGSFSNFGGVPNVPTGGGNFDSDPGGSDFSSALALQPGQGIFDNVALLAALAVVGVLIALVFVFFSSPRGRWPRAWRLWTEGRPGDSVRRSGRASRTSGACSGTTCCSS